MSRTALHCGVCGTVLAFKRKGDFYSPMDGVQGASLNDGKRSILICPVCKAEMSCAGVRMVLVPRLRVTMLSVAEMLDS